MTTTEQKLREEFRLLSIEHARLDAELYATDLSFSEESEIVGQLQRIEARKAEIGRALFLSASTTEVAA